jgi:hypothetical protein
MSSEIIAERERFARDFLRHHGARITGPERGPFAAELPPPLARRLRLKAGHLEAVFRAADLASQPGATLLAPGSPIFDRMLGIAQKSGGTSRRYVRREPPAVAHAYRVEVRFTFRVSYRAFEAQDEVRSIVVDAVSGEAADGRDYFRGRNLADDPEPEVAPPPEFEMRALLDTALRDLERRLDPHLARFAQRAEAQLAAESERLAEFFKALIAEEKLRLERQGTLQAEAQKVAWKERLTRETRLFAPRVSVALIGMEEIWVPVAARPPASVAGGEDACYDPPSTNPI